MTHPRASRRRESSASPRRVSSTDDERGVGHAVVIIEGTRSGGISHPQAVIDDERIAVMAFRNRRCHRPDATATMQGTILLVRSVPIVEITDDLHFARAR